MTVTSPPRRALSAHDPRLAAWRDFLSAHARLERLLDEDLQRDHGLSLAEYDTLLQLAEASDRRLRMHQLAERVLLSRSGITRLVDRLVAAGSVERDACLSDARGAEAVLTAAGLDRLRGASRTHLRGIESYFLDAISPGDLEVVGRVMHEVAAAVSGAAATGLTAAGEERRAG